MACDYRESKSALVFKPDLLFITGAEGAESVLTKPPGQGSVLQRRGVIFTIMYLSCIVFHA